VHVKSGQNIIKFKVDTRAEVTVISEKTWSTLNQPEPLQPPDTILCGPDWTRLIVLGKKFLTITHKETYCTQPVYVVKNITNNLLGFPAIKALKLVSHEQSVDYNTISQYPSFFTGLDTFANEYKINLKLNAQPLL